MALSAAAAQRRSTSGRDAPGWPDETLTSSIERLVVSFGESSTGGFGLRGSSFFLRGVSKSGRAARNCDLPDDESRRPRQDQPESQQRFKGKRVVAHRRNDGGCRRRMEQFSHRVDCPERPEACTSLGDEFSRRLRQCGGFLKINRPNEKRWFVPGKRWRCRWERRWARRSHPHPPIDCGAVSPDYKEGNWKREDCGKQQVHEASKNEKPAIQKLRGLIHWKGARSSFSLSPRVHTVSSSSASARLLHFFAPKPRSAS